MQTRTFEDVVERMLAGVTPRPQTSADLDSNGPLTVVVGRASHLAGSATLSGPFVLSLAHAAAIPRRPALALPFVGAARRFS